MLTDGPMIGLRGVARAIGRAALTVALALFVVTALLATRTEAHAATPNLQSVSIGTAVDLDGRWRH